MEIRQSTACDASRFYAAAWQALFDQQDLFPLSMVLMTIAFEWRDRSAR